MKLTVIDSPGFGDQINNENWWVLARALNTENWGYFNQKVATDLNSCENNVKIVLNICSDLFSLF